MINNQEGVLAEWRRIRAAGDPAFYSRHGDMIWLNMRGNVGWYRPVVREGVLVELHSEAAGGADSLVAHLNPKQKRKIAALFP